MVPSPVMQYHPQSQGHIGQTPQSPGMMGTPHQLWQQMGGQPQTPVSSREPRLYSSPGVLFINQPT